VHNPHACNCFKLLKVCNCSIVEIDVHKDSGLNKRKKGPNWNAPVAREVLNNMQSLYSKKVEKSSFKYKGMAHWNKVMLLTY
jgi:hypothetical protein